MPSRIRPDTPSVFASLADIVRQGSTTKEIYAATCVAATLTVPGCDHASLTIRRDGGYRTAAVSDAVARRIDKLESALGSGPCLDIVESRAAQLEPDLSADTRWPVFAQRVIAETPVRGAMSIRLPFDRARVGVLKLFSDTANALDSSSVEGAQVLGAFATVAISATTLREDAETLRRGLVSNREIGQAVGILMALNQVSEDDAFDTLRHTSQSSNVKLADIAADVVRRRRRRGPGKSA